ncbi:MAG: hypothetical protein H6632_09640 [Anaerolineales bacterium]|nr:hypothetical protein [Anaerolineales bacterium]
MSVNTMPAASVQNPAHTPSFDPLAGGCTIAAGAINFLYAVAFVIIARSNPHLGSLLSALCLLLSGLLVTTTVTALYQRLRTVDATLALWALPLGLAGALGAAIHGGYDLGNAINPPAIGSELTANLASLPSQIDPRGLTTFGIMGLALFVFTWLMNRHSGFPKGLVYLGYVFAALFVMLYLARLIVFNPANPLLLVPVLVTGFVVNPIWHIWLGLTLRRGVSQI